MVPTPKDVLMEASRARAAEKKEAERLRKAAKNAAAKAKKVRAL